MAESPLVKAFEKIEESRYKLHRVPCFLHRIPCEAGRAPNPASWRAGPFEEAAEVAMAAFENDQSEIGDNFSF